MRNGQPLSILFFLIILLSCGSPKDKLIGKWRFVSHSENSILIPQTEAEKSRVTEIEFFPNGDFYRYDNGQRAGIGTETYKIKGDSLYNTIISIEPDGPDTVIFACHYTIKRDTLKVENDSKMSKWVRSK